jgi:hypothetical protein
VWQLATGWGSSPRRTDTSGCVRTRRPDENGEHRPRREVRGLRDPESRSIATLGLRYEIPSGSEDVFQGKADGVFNPFLSAGWSWGNLHLLGYTGARLPVSGADSSFFDLSLHADYQIGMFYPLLEWNWVHVLDGAGASRSTRRASTSSTSARAPPPART